MREPNHARLITLCANFLPGGLAAILENPNPPPKKGIEECRATPGTPQYQKNRGVGFYTGVDVGCGLDPEYAAIA